MKRCPSCGNTYTNDSLVFCLEDGATLVSVSDSQSKIDSEATLQIDESLLPTVQAQDQRAASTLVTPTPPVTSPPRSRARTNDNQSAPAASSSTRSTNPLLIIGITAIAVLLLVIAGLGIALLVRSSSSDKVIQTENKNGVTSGNQNRNPSNTSVSSNTGNASGRENSNGANRNGAGADAFARAEAKVVRGTPVAANDLAVLSSEELRRLRNTVYARHGRTFDAPDLQRYFDSRPWYKPRYDYNESELTQTDRANIKLIQTAENK